MPTDERPWTDPDRDLVARTWMPLPGQWAPSDREYERAGAVLDALTADGWRDAEHVAMLRALIADLADTNPRHRTHHGYCQTHGWMVADPACPHARAQELLQEGPDDAR